MRISQALALTILICMVALGFGLATIAARNLWLIAVVIAIVIYSRHYAPRRHP